MLEYKWGIVTKKTLDDFLEVLKWSTDFGVDTENGRDLKKSVVPVFAAGTFNPKEKLVVNGERVTLSQYANRLNIRLLRTADFNVKLHERGIEKTVTVQKICQACGNEQQVRTTLDGLWSSPVDFKREIDALMQQNSVLFEFENRLTS